MNSDPTLDDRIAALEKQVKEMRKAFVLSISLLLLIIIVLTLILLNGMG